MPINIVRTPLAKTAVLVGMFLFLAVLGLLYRFAGEDHARQILERIDSFGGWAGLVFVGIVVIETVFILPGVIFTLSAGFLFGLFFGMLYFSVGAIIGGAIAYFSGRFLFGDRIMAYFQQHPRLALANANLRLEGWRFIFLTRLVPFFPYKLSNYALGLAKFPFGHFILGSLLGNIPISLFMVYIGTIAGNLSNIQDRAEPQTAMEWTLYVVGLVVAGLAIWQLTRMARRAFAPYLAELESIPADTN
jgi:uncharacterized membrane protein YdjX (TVP38/TMEM64 family)